MMTEPNETTDDAPLEGGEWYLSMLGIDLSPPPPPPAPAPTRSQTTEMTFEIVGATDSVSTPTPLEPPTMEQPAVPPPLEPAAEVDLLDWKPGGLAKQVERRRNFRWSLVVLAAVVVAAVVSVWLWLPTTVAAEANDEAADYRVVIAALRDLLPDAQQTLATATDPATSAIDLFPLSAPLTRLESAASEVVNRAARPLPETLPLAPRGALEELEPTRDRMQALGESGIAIVSRMSATITYRTVLDGVLVYPSLPVRADPSQIDGLAVSLAETLASSTAVLGDLPLDEAFAAHRQQVAAAIDSFETWQETYLEALRTQDRTGAEALIREVESLREGLFSSLVSGLATIRSEVDARILDLNDAATAAIAGIPR